MNTRKQQDKERIQRERIRAQRRASHEKYLATLPPLEERQRRNRENREFNKRFKHLIGNTERKIGRPLTFSEVYSGQLVMAKHEDDPKVRTAWFDAVNPEEGTAILHVKITCSRQIPVIAEATPQGTFSDENRRVIQVWEYMNLDGTPFKPPMKESKK